MFQVFRGVNGQKVAQNDKKLCLLCLISQEPHSVHPPFLQGGRGVGVEPPTKGPQLLEGVLGKEGVTFFRGEVAIFT